LSPSVFCLLIALAIN